MASKYQTVDDVMDAECCGQPMAIGMEYINGGSLPVLSCQECEAYTILPAWLWQQYLLHCIDVATANRQWVRELEASNG